MIRSDAHSRSLTDKQPIERRSSEGGVGRVLLCAYACSPDRGSEESVGWDTSVQLAGRGHEVVVLTRSCEKHLSENKAKTLNLASPPLFVDCNISSWWTALFSRMGKIGVDLAYFIWLIKARGMVRKLHRLHQFTSTQHVTYARYWMPSPLSILDIPFIWGPVGGGESIPKSFISHFSFSGRMFETLRNGMRLLGESLSPTRSNATRSLVALANTRETATRMKRLGASSIRIMNSAALSTKDQLTLAVDVPKPTRLTFISVGRLLEWKGFQYGIQAFAKAGLTEARYIIVGSGPYRSSLIKLSQKLGLEDRVEFLEAIPRADLFTLMSSSHALIHPSMHESGGYVCLEMMAAGNPVICLDAGGPALFVDRTCGLVATTDSVAQSTDEMAAFMVRLSRDPSLGCQLGESGRQRVKNRFSMSVKSDELSAIHKTFAAINCNGPESIVRVNSSFEGAKSTTSPKSSRRAKSSKKTSNPRETIRRTRRA